jgi:hypothetical protein
LPILISSAAQSNGQLFSQIPLLDQLIGIDTAPFKVSREEVSIDESDGWTWKGAVQYSEPRNVSCFSPNDSMVEKGCMSFPASLAGKRTPISSAVTSGAMALLSAAPVARDTIPCVHEGFLEVYSVIRKKLIESLLPVLQRQMSKAFVRRESASLSDPDPLVLPKIYITGHSLGGSLAQLLGKFSDK